MRESTFAQWNERIADVFDVCGDPSFPEKLNHALQGIVDFDLCMVFSYSESHGAVSLFHNMPKPMSDVVVDDYIAGPYLLDPFFDAVKQGKTSGFGAMRDLAPDMFYRSEFHRHHYVRTGIADEIGIFFGLSPDVTAVLSITRQDGHRQFTPKERQVFASVSPIIETLGRSHWAGGGNEKTLAGRGNELDAAFDSFAKDDLTSREREVVTLVLKGHSSPSISHVLDISAGTVKIHRKHAYEKLNISSQAELFSAFISFLQNRLFS